MKTDITSSTANAPSLLPRPDAQPPGFDAQASLSVSLPLAEFGERVVRLCDGRAGLRGGLHAEVRESAEKPSSESHRPAVLDFIASSEALDRFGEIISAEGWRLENYRRNPVFQNAHQYGDVIFTLGKALITEVRTAQSSSCLFQRIEFAVEVNPMARIAYGLYRGKFLNAVSVGFIPLRWENGDAQAGYRRKYLEQELLEVSAVGIPANPEALQLGLRAGAIDKADLQALLDLLRSALSSQPSTTNSQPFSAAPNAHAGAPGVRSDGAQLLQLARALRDILRRT